MGRAALTRRGPAATIGPWSLAMVADLSDVEREIERITKQLAQLRIAADVLRALEAQKAPTAPQKPEQPETAHVTETTPARIQGFFPEPGPVGTKCAGLTAAEAAFFILTGLNRRAHYKDIAARAMRNGFRPDAQKSTIETTIRRSMGKNLKRFRQLGDGWFELRSQEQKERARSNGSATAHG